MSPYIGRIVSLCFLLGLADATHAAGSLTAHLQTPDSASGATLGKHLAYVEYLPTGYDAGQTHPVVIMLHGWGERLGYNTASTDAGQVMAKGTANGPCKLLASSAAWRAYFDAKNAIVVCPLSNDAGYDFYDDFTLGNAVAETVARYGSAIDSNRVYLTGLSMGGAGTAIVGLKHPEWLTATVPIGAAGGGAWRYQTVATGADKLAVWEFNNAYDNLNGEDQPNNNMRVFMNQLAKARGFASSDCWPSPHPSLGGTSSEVLQSNGTWPLSSGVTPPNDGLGITLYNSSGHGGWDETYGNQVMWDWLFGRTKGQAPNAPPTVATSGMAFPTSVTAGAILAFQVTVSDRDGDAFTTDVYLDGKVVRSSSAAGFSVSLDTSMLSSGAHSIDVVAEDVKGHSSSTILAFTVVPPVTSGSFSKIPLTPSMIVREPGVTGDPTLLVDENGLAGDPATTTTGQPQTQWDAGWNSSDFPMSIYIDLGAKYELSDLYAWDANGQGTWQASTGAPGQWSAPVIIDLNGYQRWSKSGLNATTRYVRITRAMGVGCNEIVLYGRPVSASGPVPHDVYVDLGTGTQRTNGYNNVADQAQARGGRIDNLTDGNAVATGISLAVSGFNDVNSNGTTMPDAALGLSPTATSDSFYGNLGYFNGAVASQGTVVLGGLDPATEYELRLFASRTGVFDNRETLYSVNGAATRTALLQVANNTNARAVFSALRPKPDGTLTINVTPGPANNNAYKFFYLGAIELHYVK